LYLLPRATIEDMPIIGELAEKFTMTLEGYMQVAKGRRPIAK